MLKMADYTHLFISSVPEDGEEVDGTDWRGQEWRDALNVIKQLRCARISIEKMIKEEKVWKYMEKYLLQIKQKIVWMMKTQNYNYY